jgi:hypothetical protein
MDLYSKLKEHSKREHVLPYMYIGYHTPAGAMIIPKNKKQRQAELTDKEDCTIFSSSRFSENGG